VDDEVLPEPEPEPAEVVAETIVPPALPLRFDESQPVPEGPYGPLIYEAARKHQVNPRLVAALIRQESAGNIRAVSHKGARGLMQLMPATAKRFGVRKEQLFDPQHNLDAGVHYLSWLVDQFPNDLAKILAAYNAGENAVARYGGVPPYRETRDYVRRIFTNLGLTITEL
jgi:soluble lytic murein transglycosylase-like protein